MERRKRTVVAILTLAVLAVAVPAMAGGAIRVAGAIWAHGELYDTVVTPTSFVSPPEHSTDVIYNFALSGLTGQRSVADAAPGDSTFNGGRWSVSMVVFTPAGLAVHDGDNDGVADFELTSADEVLHHQTLGHLAINPANFYFECPMLPRRR